MKFRYFLSFILLFSVSNGYSKTHKIHVIDKLIESSTDSITFTDKRLDSIKLLIKDDNYESALNRLYAIIDDNEKKKDSVFLQESYLLIGDLLRDNGDFESSNEYLAKVLGTTKKNDSVQSYIYFKRGGNFQQLNELDSAQVNYERAISTASLARNSNDLMAKTHANLSGIFYLRKNYTKAIEHSEIAVNYQQILGNLEIEAGILNNLGGIYYMQGNYSKALENFQAALNIVGYGQEDLQKQTRNSAYINMAYAYSGMGNYKKAFEFQDRFFSLNDSLQNELKYKELAEIESNYKIESKEREAEAEKAKRQKAEFISYGLGLAAVLLLVLVYIFYKLYSLNKKNYRLQLKQKQLVHDSHIEKLKREAQFKILAATLDGRLEERKEIASVLHDNVSALLSAANMHIHALKNSMNNEPSAELNKTQEIILEASKKIRDLSHKLLPVMLYKFGLTAALKDICEKLSNSCLTLTSEVKNVGRFDQDFEIKIYNIINELLNNILKHSNARKGTIKMEQLDGKLQIVVFDNGKGFDFDKSTNDRGVGLSQVEARIKVLNGLIKINSRKNETRIFISVPAQY